MHSKLATKGLCFELTWDQAQFEQFSYILSNGCRCSYCPPECNFQSETKIEPDLRLVLNMHKGELKCCSLRLPEL